MNGNVNRDDGAAPNDDVSQETETAGRLALAIGRLNRRMITGGTGLSHGLLSALSSLVKLGPLRLGDLAAQERVAAATVTRIVASLEGKGLATRTADPNDGRSFVIDATVAGTELILRARSARAELIAHLMQSLDASDADVLRDALPVLEKLVTAELGAGGNPAEHSHVQVGGDRR